MSLGDDPFTDRCSSNQSISSNSSTMMSSMMNGMTKQSADRQPSVFNSMDFGMFLSKEYKNDNGMGKSGTFLSKDTLLPSFSTSIFKSKDAFSKMFPSNEWDMKYNTHVEPPKTQADSSPKKMFAALQTPQPVAMTKPAALQSIMTSRDWMPLSTLGNHVDVSYTQDIFNGSDSETEQTVSAPAPAAALTVDPPAEPLKTDWSNMMFSQMQLIPPATPTTPTGEEDKFEFNIEPEEVEQPQDVNMAPPADLASDSPDLQPEEQPSQPAEPAQQAPKRKRKRKPRKKVVPEVKVYVEPLDMDVLLGRGGRSNHHPGNKRYREEVKNLKSWYMGIEDKDEKTDLSQCLVDYVHAYKGRFLEKDEEGWYEVPNIVARRKASQALREDDDPKKRAEKRARYLKKKAQKEAEASKTGIMR